MKPVIGKRHWFVVIQATPYAYIEGDLVVRRNHSRLSFELTRLDTAVIDVKTGVRRVLS